jgi:hypothetical protein
MSILLSKQQHNKSKRRRIVKTLSVPYALNKPKPFIKTVGRNSDDQGRIYLPGFWIGKTVNGTPVLESDRLLLHCARLVAPMILNGKFKGVYLRGVLSIGKFYQTKIR